MPQSLTQPNQKASDEWRLSFSAETINQERINGNIAATSRTDHSQGFYPPCQFGQFLIAHMC
jgi:hypothetical protein